MNVDEILPRVEDVFVILLCLNSQHAELFKDYKRCIHILNCILDLAWPK